MATNQTLTIEFNSHLTPNAYNKEYNERFDILSFNLFQTMKNFVQEMQSSEDTQIMINTFSVLLTIYSQVFELQKKNVHNLLQ